MNAISKTFPMRHTNTPRSLLRDSGVGLALVLTVLAMTAVGTWGNAGIQTIGSLPGHAAAQPLAGWENSLSPEPLQLAPVTNDAPM
jgi:hypothetical protein